MGKWVSKSSYLLQQSVLDAVVSAYELEWSRKQDYSLIVAFSGGEDSHVLLHALQTLLQPPWEMKINLTLAHFNHGLRKESEEEQRLVYSIAKLYQLPVLIGRAEEKPPKENLENWARKVRYGFLERARLKAGADFILTAHHQNDQAETLLLRLLSGRLLRSNYGIASLDKSRHLIRPLLALSKQQISAYARENKLVFAVDQSNFDLARTRNLLRHQVLPELSHKLNPSLTQTLAATALRFGDDESYLWKQAAEHFPDLSGGVLAEEKLMSLPPSLCWRVLALYAEKLLGDSGAEVGYEALQECIELVRRKPKKQLQLELGRGVLFKREKDGALTFLLGSARELAFIPQKEPQVLRLPGVLDRYYRNGTGVRLSAEFAELGEESFEYFVELAKAGEGSWSTGARAFFDAEIIQPGELMVRERRAGDGIKVWKRGRRTVKKLLQEALVPLSRRDFVPLLYTGSSLVWIPGIARSDVAPLSQRTKRVLILSCEPLPAPR